MQTIDEALEKLSRSSFRAGFHLSRSLRAYAEEKGMDTLRTHAREFVHARLLPLIYPTTVSKRRCAVTPCSSLSTRLQRAAAAALKNGTE